MTDERSRRTADEVEIAKLLAKLAQMADDGDLNEYARLFTEDGSWTGPGGDTRTGRPDIIAGAQERRAAGIQGPGTNSFHLISNINIEVDGDAAAGKAYFHYYRNADAMPQITSMGVYRDQFRRTPEGWRMAKRVIHGPTVAPP